MLFGIGFETYILISVMMLPITVKIEFKRLNNANQVNLGFIKGSDYFFFKKVSLDSVKRFQ